VDCSSLSVAEQAQTFAQASHVIALHGAGLANVVFMKAGSACLELRANDIWEHPQLLHQAL
jgi:capsular polysaccharide biosynthesis protein